MVRGDFLALRQKLVARSIVKLDGRKHGRITSFRNRAACEDDAQRQHPEQGRTARSFSPVNFRQRTCIRVGPYGFGDSRDYRMLGTVG